MQDQDKIPVFLSYLGFVGLVPPFVAYFLLAQSAYARFHAQQGILLTMVFLMGSIPLGVVRFLWGAQEETLRIIYIVSLGWFLLYILCNLLAAVLGLWGKTWRIPLLHRLVRLAAS
jgi:uncharacterized membrane protein